MDDQLAGRVIAHVDLDAFYAQVEVRRDARLAGQPVGVVQYNPFGDLRTLAPDQDRVFNDSNGSLIAVSYEARACGVKRNMRGDEARRVCPALQLVQVPTAHGKADLTLYRDCGTQVLNILARLAVAERASVDECYLDLTREATRRLAACSGNPLPPVNPEQVHVFAEGGQQGARDWWSRPGEAWGPGQRLLACGAAAVAELRAAVRAELGYTCSAGVAHSKLLAKLASGLHKPAQQTLVPLDGVPGLLADLPIPKLRQLGGQLGQAIMARLGIATVGELAAVPQAQLEAAFGGARGAWLAGMARGRDGEAVKPRALPLSLSCGKTFRRQTALRRIEDVHHWLQALAQELEERAAVDRAAHARTPRLLTVGFLPSGGDSLSRACPLRRPVAAAMADDATALVRRWAGEAGPGWSIEALYLGASSFVAAPTGASTISRYMRPAASTPPTSPVGGPAADTAQPDAGSSGPQHGHASVHEAGQPDCQRWSDSEGPGNDEASVPHGQHHSVQSRGCPADVGEADAGAAGSGSTVEPHDSSGCRREAPQQQRQPAPGSPAGQAAGLAGWAAADVDTGPSGSCPAACAAHSRRTSAEEARLAAPGRQGECFKQDGQLACAAAAQSVAPFAGCAPSGAVPDSQPGAASPPAPAEPALSAEALCQPAACTSPRAAAHAGTASISAPLLTYRPEEIDSAVWAELPLVVQRELAAALRLQQQPQGSSLTGEAASRKRARLSSVRGSRGRGRGRASAAAPSIRQFLTSAAGRSGQ